MAIVVRGDEVLLMHRVKPGKDYYTLPGGSIEDGETAEEACVRELLEETTLVGEIEAPLWVLDNQGRTEHYFLIAPVEGRARLGDGPEVSRPDDVYEVVWVPLREVPELNLLPTLIRDRLTAVVFPVANRPRPGARPAGRPTGSEARGRSRGRPATSGR